MNNCQNRPKLKSNTVQIIESKSNNFGIDPALLLIIRSNQNSPSLALLEKIK